MISVRNAILSSGLRERARSTAVEIGERLLEEVRRPDAIDFNGERFASRMMNGTVGYALTFLALAQATADARFERAMHEQLKRAAEADDEAAIGLFDGVSGMRAVATLATAIEPRYASFVQRCDAHVDSALAERPLEIESFATYDVISGWAGIRLARCLRDPQPPDEASARMEWFLEDERRWARPHRFRPDGASERNLGLAHGLPGVLAALAIGAETIDARLRALLHRSAVWVLDQARVSNGHRAWPRAVEEPLGQPCRSVWCYGTAGVAVALLQVARRIGDARIEAAARASLLDICERPSQTLGLGQQGLCHGTSGLAMILFAAAMQTGDERFARGCERFVLETLDGFAAAGNRCVTMGLDDAYYDALGELLGASGIALALLTAAGDFEPAWLRMHALDVESC